MLGWYLCGPPSPSSGFAFTFCCVKEGMEESERSLGRHWPRAGTSSFSSVKETWFLPAVALLQEGGIWVYE